MFGYRTAALEVACFVSNSNRPRGLLFLRGFWGVVARVIFLGARV